MKTTTVSERCTASHNPGVWPYVSRCVLATEHGDKHVDRHGNEWESEHSK